MASERQFSIGKIPDGQKFGGQAQLIMESLRAKSPQSVKSVAADIKDRLTTRQEPERVVAFYFSTWKKKGIVKMSEVEVPDEEGGKESTKPAGQVEDGGDDETEEEDEEDDDENSAGEVNEEKLGDEQRVELHEELSAAEPSHGGKFDGLRPSEAVLKVLQDGKHNKAADIEEYLKSHGYESKKGGVATSLANLVRQGAARKEKDGSYRPIK